MNTEALQEAARQQIEQAARHEVGHIQRGLKRTGTTECEDCGDEIPEARRKAIPSTRWCIDCQASYEKEAAL